MSGFGFGNTGSTTPGTAFNYGSNKTTTPGFTLGTTATSLPAANLFGSTPTFGTASTLPSGLSFGAATTSQPATGLFGSPAGQTTGLSFGTPVSSAAPTGFTFGSTSTPTGLSFGTPNVGQTGGISFGNAATPTGQTGLSFGTPTTTTTGLTFGSPATTATGLTFGTPATTATGLTFGTPATTTTGLTFGTPATTATGLTFGTPATTTAGLTFGTPATTTAQTGFSLGTSTGLTFGAPTTSAPSTGLTFGTPNVTTTQTGLTFPTPTTTSGISGSLSFSTPASTIAAPLGFQGLSTTVTTAAKPLGTLTFGTATPVTSTTGFSLSTPATTSQSTGFTLGGTTTSTSGGGLFGLGSTKPLLFSPATSTSTSVGLAGTSVSTATTPSIGLGGVDASKAKSGITGTSPGRPDSKAVKENQIPNELLQTIETFKNFVKTQKGLSSDIARGSVKPLHKVQEDTESLKQMLAGLTSGLQRNEALADRLKADTAKCLHHAEMAQRTHETPPGLQYDNVAPIEYFTELVAGFERDMQVFRQEIENTEKHILSLSHPMALTPQELALAMRRLHDSFVALAGRLQTVHNSVEMQKEQYLNLRKYFLKDSTNVFEEQAKKTTAGGIKPVSGVKISPGPTPFSVLGNQHGFGLLPTNTAEPKPFPSGNPLGWCGQQQSSQLSANLGGNLFSSGGLSGGGLNTLPTPQPVDNQSFQLQKPPPGNKRGKR